MTGTTGTAYDRHIPPPPFDWADLGVQLRGCADTMHGGLDTPSVGLAYRFLLENAACFVTQAELDIINEGKAECLILTMEDVRIGNVEWPANMPQEPNIELIAGYYLKS